MCAPEMTSEDGSTGDCSASTPAPAPGPAGPAHAQRVLVVDDDPAVRLVLARALARCGYEVFVAASGADALAQLHRDPSVAAVLSELAMPTVRIGAEFAAELHVRHPGLPILFVTATVPAGDLLAEPGIGVVAKPAGVTELRDALATLISDSAERPQPG